MSLSKRCYTSRETRHDLNDSDGILQVFGREVLSRTPRQRSRLIDGALSYWRSRGFPYPELSRKEQEQEFRHLERVRAVDVIQGRDIKTSTLGLRLANYFHPQIWSIPARRHLHSPLDHFWDRETLIKLLDRAARFWPDRRCWNAQCLRSVLRIYAGGRVSNLRPTAARAIITKYSKRGETVLDFSAGFGGRLLGCLTLQRRFLAIDPAEAQIWGLRKMVTALHRYTNTEVEIFHGCAEDLMPKFYPSSVDLVFSSPPYFDVEKYSPEETQSYRRYPSYKVWKEQFLCAVISASQRILRRGGHLIINVADTQRHAIEKDIEGMVGALLRKRHVLKLMMHSRPLQRSAGADPYRWEPVLVFRKLS